MDEWTSADGREITAEFVKAEGETVTLSVNGNVVDVPRANLSAESQAFAAWHEERRAEWIAERLSMASISEDDLLRLVALDPAGAEGRSFLVEGVVKSAGKPGGLARRGPGEAELVLRGGTRSEVVFEEADGSRTKLQFDLDAVNLTKARRIGASGASNFTLEKVLLRAGEPVVIRVAVRNGRIEGAGLAPEGEVIEARMRAAAERGGMSAEQFAGVERARIRLEFLEKALSSGVSGTASGTATAVNPGGGMATAIGSTTYYFSEAEMEAMRREADLLRAQIRLATE